MVFVLHFLLLRKCIGVFDMHGKLIETIDASTHSGTNLLFPVKVAFSIMTKEVLVLGEW